MSRLSLLHRANVQEVYYRIWQVLREAESSLPNLEISGVRDIRIDSQLFIQDYEVDSDASITYCFDECIRDVIEPGFKRALYELEKCRPNPDDYEKFEQWVEVNGISWVSRLREVVTRYRNINHDWNFTQQQRELLAHYCDANDLLFYCLSLPNIYVSRSVREEIESTLLLPIAEIQKRQNA